MKIRGAKFQEHCLNTSRDVFHSVFFHFLVAKHMTSSLILFGYYKNVNISETKKDISKRKISKGVLNKQKIFFMSYTLLSSVSVNQLKQPCPDYNKLTWLRTWLQLAIQSKISFWLEGNLKKNTWSLFKHILLYSQMLPLNNLFLTFF